MKRLTLLEKVLAGLVLAGIFFFLLREGCAQREKDNLVKNISQYKDSAQHYALKVNGLEVEVATNNTLKFESDKQIKSALGALNDTLAKLVKKFKSIQSGTIINNYTTINGDTIKIQGDSIPCDFKPFKVRRDSLHYKFTGTIAKNYFSIDTLLIPDKISLLIGRKKTGFLKWEDRAEIIHSNPLVKTTNVRSYETIKRKKRIGLGVSAGYGINFSNATLSPQLGVSVNYNIFEF